MNSPLLTDKSSYSGLETVLQIRAEFCSILEPAVGRIVYTAANATVTQFIFDGYSREHISDDNKIR